MNRHLEEIALTVPASKEYAPVACMTLCGMGMLAGLDVDLLGDLRTVTNECLDCLIHQEGKPERIDMHAYVKQGRLVVAFTAQERSSVQPKDALDLEITRGVLETLMPEVQLFTDAHGVYGIECAMTV